MQDKLPLWRRIVKAVLAALLTLVLLAGLFSGCAPSQPADIAATTLPDLPLDRAVVEIQIANNLSTSQVQAGQTLVIPTP